jgi:hypothetical protein
VVSLSPALVAVVEVEQHGAEAPGAPGILPGQHHVHHAPRAPGQDHGRRGHFRAPLGRHARAGWRRGGRRGRRHPSGRRRRVVAVASRPRRRRRSAAPRPGQAQPEELQLRRLAVVPAHPRLPPLRFWIIRMLASELTICRTLQCTEQHALPCRTERLNDMVVDQYGMLVDWSPPLGCI